MTKRGQVRRNIDDVVYISTGKRLKNIVGTALNSFGEEAIRLVSKKVSDLFDKHFTEQPEEPKIAPDSPYVVLGVNPEAPDFLIRGAYRMLMKKFHPDGETPNEELAKKINDAYDQICLEREISK